MLIYGLIIHLYEYDVDSQVISAYPFSTFFHPLKQYVNHGNQNLKYILQSILENISRQSIHHNLIDQNVEVEAVTCDTI